ncbi:DNA mismatch repair protein Mlh1 [Cryptotrichosporon argae]
MDIDEPTADADAPEPAGPRPILRLSKDVVNQIAAAEIIQRPANAIKELVENSLDAGATSVRVVLKEGGLKSIQITDNGHGITKSDLPLLCTRYATSKLRTFNDLQSLATYGFRGEALASISYCAHVEVVTKTRADGCGWRATYVDGELVARGTGLADPRPTAANDGTVITAEDLFYNMPQRKRAFKSASDEYGRVLDVVTKYAVHNPHAAWAGTALPDVSTPAASTSRANIGLLYTPALAAELLEVAPTTLEPARLGAKVEGWVSGANASWSRRGGWLLFINHRLVDSSKIKRAVESLYTAYLPKGSSPFVYLSLEIDPAKVDVNVHPTKAEVHFLNEYEIVDGIVGAVSRSLAGANSSRTFTVQTLLPGAETIERREPVKTHKPAPNYKVRTDPTNRTLDSMIAITNPSQLGAYTETEVGASSYAESSIAAAGRPSKRRGVDPDETGQSDDRERMWDADDEPRDTGRDVVESMCEFESIGSLRRAVKRRANQEMCDIMARHAFVGIVDRDLCQSLIQHGTQLYLVDHARLAAEHMYQLALRQFGALGRIRLEPAPALRDLLALAAAADPGVAAAGLEVDDVVDGCEAVLRDKREMVDEYFSLSLADDGAVQTIPLVLKGYTPDLDRLPRFLLCLATRVDWESEKECFESFLRELADFYAPRPFGPVSRASESEGTDVGRDGQDDDGPTDDERRHADWQLEHVLFPSLRRGVWAREDRQALKQVANLPDLFRVFERC